MNDLLEAMSCISSFLEKQIDWLYMNNGRRANRRLRSGFFMVNTDL
jgi:hypothetical protein